MTISEAIKTYVDSYTPDVLVMRKNERKMSAKLFTYELEFLGKNIEVSSLRPHFVSIKVPTYFVDKIIKVSLLHNNIVKETWNKFDGYSDLRFKIEEKDGYTIKLYLE